MKNVALSVLVVLVLGVVLVVPLSNFEITQKAVGYYRRFSCGSYSCPSTAAKEWIAPEPVG